MTDKDLLVRMAQSIIDGNKDDAQALAKKAIETRMNLTEVIESGYVPGIQKVGQLWEEGEYFLPELITSAECMKSAMAVLQPELDKSQIETQSLGRIVIGTVEGDIHDIGKNLVASMLSANGFEVIDLGADVKIETFLKKAEEVNADLICLSALLTTTMLGQKRLIQQLEERGFADRFIVMVGGAPVNQNWADDIGADGYAENAMTAVRAAKTLLNK
jgi:corrinoid protein of di/trimethylamine methyltransferase